MSETQTLLQEQQEFKECLSFLKKSIETCREQVQKRNDQYKELYAAYNSGEVELYDQLLVTESLIRHSENVLRKNIAAYDKPYFGRLNYTHKNDPHPHSIRIGKNGITKDKSDVLIVDWRAPISTVYYENELGEGTFLLPDGSIQDINLSLKRTFDVGDHQLNGFFDSTTAASDELLVQYLSQNKDAVLGDIIATIQKEQNEIIRSSPFSNILVQGVAGSGKTTVAMHRISYILYNYKQRFSSNEFCIIGSSDMLINYITSGLPELDVYDVKQKRMDGMLTYLLKKEWKKKFKQLPLGDTSPAKCTMEFILSLERYLAHLRKEALDFDHVVDETYGTLLKKEANAFLIEQHPEFSLTRMVTLFDERLKTSIKSRFSDDTDRRNAIAKKYNRYYRSRLPKYSITQIYEDFLSSYKGGIPSHTGAYDIYDIAALNLIHYRVLQKKPDEEFGQIFIDEAQDFGASIYYVLRTILPHCVFTIMGDVSQNLRYETGLNHWDDLKEIFHGKKDAFRLLCKSYRNTIEISAFAGGILKHASKGSYTIEPVIRHGLPVHQVCAPKDEMAQTAAALIKEINSRGYDTVAVICSNEEETDATVALLSHYCHISSGEESGFNQGTMVLPVTLTKGLEFDAVLLWNPDMESAKTSEKSAKYLYVAATRALHELHILTCQ